MPQLDQLIGALVKHRAEALILVDGENPFLIAGGAPRPIVRTPLNAVQIRRLLSEIAPTEQRDALTEGQAVSFSYLLGADTVLVEVNESARTEIRVDAPSGAPIHVPVADPAAPSRPPAVSSARALSMDELFRDLVERRGSDLHLSSGSRPLLRIDGEMLEMADLEPLDAAAAERLLLSITPERNREEFAQTGDTDFAYQIEGLSRFRCNLFRDRKGAGGVFRVIPSKILSASDLDLAPQIQDLCRLTKGLVLVTGPTGSGKSTTLAALIDLINSTRRDHVITIEDPIEFVHPNKSCLINQREVHLHTRGFKAALRAALREDPDIVLVGEMRDLETVAIALETAETGHLVFGTLHTCSAVSTVDRVIDQFPADQQAQIRIMLSESLKAVIAQVLCRKIGGGRVAALEVLLVNAAVSNLIREGKTFQIPSIMQTGRASGMTLMNDSLVDLVHRRLVDPQEAYLKAIDKPNLLSAFKAKGIPLHTVDGPRTLQPA